MFDLKNLFLLKGLSEEEKERFINRCRVVIFPKDAVIYGKDNFEKSLGIILEGKAVALTGNAEKGRFGEGSVFGAAAIYGSGDTYVSEIVAKTECKAAFVSEDTVKKTVRESNACAENYIEFLSEKIRYLNEKITHYACGDAGERIMAYLGDAAKKQGNMQVNITNMAETAKLVGLSRSQFYAGLDELEKNGKIKKEGKKITVM